MKKYSNLNIYRTYRIHSDNKITFENMVNEIRCAFRYTINKMRDNIYIDCFNSKDDIVGDVLIIRNSCLDKDDVIYLIKMYERNYKINKILDS